MRLPIPFLLYVVTLGLFCWTGWTVYEMLPSWNEAARTESSRWGARTAETLLASHAKGPFMADWRYDKPNTDAFWSKFKQLNLIGKLPPPPPPPPGEDPRKKIEVEVPATPLEEIFELVSLVYDGSNNGKGPKTHVIIRYKVQDVVPPQWWERENTPATSAGFAGGTDMVRPPTGRGPQQPVPRPRAGATMPVSGSSLTGRQITQELWLVDDEAGEELKDLRDIEDLEAPQVANSTQGQTKPEEKRRTSRLWPKYQNIRLVGVSEDAQIAYFVRDGKPPAEGEPAPEPKQEPLYKTTMNLSQKDLAELHRLQGKSSPSGAPSTVPDSTPVGSWRAVEETTRFGNEFHIGRNDEQRFRGGADEFLSGISADTYVGSSTRGVQLRQVDSQMSQRFGLVQGDVLLEINNRKVESKAQATNQVKREYERGVRMWSTKWLSNGQIVERVYQAPPEK